MSAATTTTSSSLCHQHWRTLLLLLHLLIHRRVERAAVELELQPALEHRWVHVERILLEQRRHPPHRDLPRTGSQLTSADTLSVRRAGFPCASNAHKHGGRMGHRRRFSSGRGATSVASPWLSLPNISTSASRASSRSSSEPRTSAIAAPITSSRKLKSKPFLSNSHTARTAAARWACSDDLSQPAGRCGGWVDVCRC